LSSGHGRAGVAVVRISGPEAEKALRTLAGGLPEPRRAGLRSLRRLSDGAILDRALVLWLPGPTSFTGEDAAEFHIHGGRAVVSATLDALGEIAGLRIAEPGEFSRRAFDNGKLDLAQAEALADLIDAETELQRLQAIGQASGLLSALYDGWRGELIDAQSLVEAEIDFSDEGDVPDQLAAAVMPRVCHLRDEIRAHLDDGHRGEILRDGFRVVLAGPPNVGKSSLLNALARRPAAIVSQEPGTTRDVIEVRLDLNGLPIVISDTAGLRSATSDVEQEGINRTFGAAEHGDLIVWMSDISAVGGAHGDGKVPFDVSPERILRVANKVDLAAPGSSAPADAAPAMAISALTGTGISELTEKISAIAADRIGECEAPPLTRARHRQLLTVTLQALEAFLEGELGALELRAEDLRIASYALGRITGRVDVEDLLDRIFSTFCIGK